AGRESEIAAGQSGARQCDRPGSSYIDGDRIGCCSIRIVPDNRLQSVGSGGKIGDGRRVRRSKYVVDHRIANPKFHIPYVIWIRIGSIGRERKSRWSGKSGIVGGIGDQHGGKLIGTYDDIAAPASPAIDR